NRSPGDDADPAVRNVSDHRAAVISKPVLDAGIYDLKTRRVPAVPHHEIACPLKTGATCCDGCHVLRTVLNAILASFHVRFQSILPPSSRPRSLETNCLRKSAPSRRSMNSFAYGFAVS